MPVQQTCPIPGGAVTLNVGAKQQLQYTVSGDADVIFQLRNQANAVLIPDPANPTASSRRWPVYPAEVPSLDEVAHSLGMVFGANERFEWRVDLLDATGATIKTIKHCQYKNPTGHEAFFDGISIFVTGRP